MKLTVLVPTYRRPADLEHCLRALEAQSRKADRVLVVARGDDDVTRRFLERFATALPLQTVAVSEPGQVAALNAGLARVDGDVVAITDDDARPRRDWLQRIERHFAADPALDGVGGRDYLRDGHAYSDCAVVGKIQWFGRHVGNHHRGCGPARPVDVLKGANMSFRMQALGSLRFDTRLLGAGAQVCNDMSLSLRLRKAGRLLRYDPAIAVDHYSAERFDDDGRRARSYAAIRNEAHNETLAILEFLPRQRWPVFLAWALLVGHRSLPGIVQCLRPSTFVRAPWRSLKAVVSGRCLGLGTLLRNARPIARRT